MYLTGNVTTVSIQNGKWYVNIDYPMQCNNSNYPQPKANNFVFASTDINKTCC